MFFFSLFFLFLLLFYDHWSAVAREISRHVPLEPATRVSVHRPVAGCPFWLSRSMYAPLINDTRPTPLLVASGNKSVMMVPGRKRSPVFALILLMLHVGWSSSQAWQPISKTLPRTGSVRRPALAVRAHELRMTGTVARVSVPAINPPVLCNAASPATTCTPYPSDGAVSTTVAVATPKLLLSLMVGAGAAAPTLVDCSACKPR